MIPLLIRDTCLALAIMCAVEAATLLPAASREIRDWWNAKQLEHGEDN